ncbi:MAG TPA: adenylyltransferase/cytidyltransferase family protein [Hansschlegelia sp.]
MTRAITYGTFDLLGAAHLDFLERAAALGDELYVGVSTDAFSRLKGDRCFFTFEARIRLVSALRCVSGVFAEHCWEQKRNDIWLLGADVICAEGEWTGALDFLRPWCRVVHLPRADGDRRLGARAVCGPPEMTFQGSSPPAQARGSRP